MEQSQRRAAKAGDLADMRVDGIRSSLVVGDHIVRKRLRDDGGIRCGQRLVREQELNGVAEQVRKVRSVCQIAVRTRGEHRLPVRLDETALGSVRLHLQIQPAVADLAELRCLLKPLGRRAENRIDDHGVIRPSDHSAK